MKFTDLNFDCLENVLEYLELVDLLNVADSTRRLNNAAVFLFYRKYGDKIVHIFQTGRYNKNRVKDIGPGIIVQGIKTSLQLLRCVGAVISKLRFAEVRSGVCDVASQYETDRMVFSYINNYCAEFLKQIEMSPARYNLSPYQLLECLDKPFTNLVRFRALNFRATEKSCFKRLFPNLQQLELAHSDNLSFFRINTNHFSYLKKLTIQQSSGNLRTLISVLQLT